MTSSSGQRVVAGVIDAGGVYTATVAAGGGFVFANVTPIDTGGRVAASAYPPEPYATSEAAQSQAQTRFAYERLRTLLPEVGSSVEQLCQLEQCVKRKAHASPYFAVAGDPRFIGKARPGGATVQVAGFHPEDVAISTFALGVSPDASGEPAKSYPGNEPISPTGLFSPLVAAGPYVFNTYFGTDNRTGIHPSARAEDWNWRGSEIRSEAAFGIKELTEKLAAGGSSLADIVNYTLFLTDPSDLFEFDELLAKAIGPNAPTRVVVPSLGFANPRREGAFGHSENAQRMEIQVRALRTGAQAKRVVIDGPGAGFGYQSAGIRVDSLLWVSGHYADVRRRGSAAAEAADILKSIGAVCEKGGTSLANALRIHALVSRAEDVPAVYAELKRVVPANPPVVSVVLTPNLGVAGAHVVLDAVAFVPGAS